MRSTFAPLIVSAFLILCATTFADPDCLQDICVADLSSGVRFNGFACKNLANVTANDFFFSGLANPATTKPLTGSAVTSANVEKLPGLNTQGISMSRIDFAPGGVNPPHTHPRASEVIFVLEGQLEVGFITTANTLITKIIQKGDVFVFPRGLLHFQWNPSNGPASAIAAFNSQFPGAQPIAMGLFESKPTVPDHVLSKAFQIGGDQVQQIKAKLAPKN